MLSINTTESSVSIAPLQASDLEEVADLAARTYIDAFGEGVPKADMQRSVKESRSVAYFERTMKTSTILVAKREGRVIGYVQFGDVKLPEVQPQRGDKELGRVYVATELQGRGIGRRLMQAALTHPELANAPHVYLQVWEQNAKAVSLYKSCGFKIIGTTKFTIGDGTEAEDLIMVLDQPTASLH